MIPAIHLADAIRDLTTLVDTRPSTARFLAEGGVIIRRLVSRDDWLPPACAVPGETYRQYPLHRDAEHRFSLVSFVWAPGQGTPVHDHLMPGIIGMLHGSEAATAYDPGPPLRPLGRVVLRPGDIATVDGDRYDLHRVENLLQDAVSISIHCYAGDIGTIHRHVWDAATGARRDFVSGYTEWVTTPHLPL